MHVKCMEEWLLKVGGKKKKKKLEVLYFRVKIIQVIFPLLLFAF